MASPPLSANEQDPALETPAQDGVELRSAVAQLEEVLEESQPLIGQALEKRDWLVRQRADGRSWADIILAEDRPQLSALLNDTLRALTDANSVYRRAMVQELHDEGLTMQRIAELLE